MSSRDTVLATIGVQKRGVVIHNLQSMPVLDIIIVTPLCGDVGRCCPGRQANIGAWEV